MDWGKFLRIFIETVFAGIPLTPEAGTMGMQTLGVLSSPPSGVRGIHQVTKTILRNFA